jgi:hypothetical protein
MKEKMVSKLVLRPGFEPGSPARKAGILGSHMVFNLAIFGSEDIFLLLLPEPSQSTMQIIFLSF